MPIRTILVSFLTLVLSSTIAPYSQGQTLRLATGEWIPFTSENMVGKGEFTRLVSIVFEEMGVTPDYVFYPWPRCFDSVAKGRIWAAFPYSRTPERAEQVWFSDMLSCSKTVFFYFDHGDPPASYSYNSLDDLKHYRVGGVSGYFYEDAFRKAGLDIDYASKEIYAIEKLKIGRIDLVPMNELVGWNLIKATYPDDADKFKTLPKPLNISPLRLIVSKTYPESESLLDRFNEALQAAVDKGRIEVGQCR